MPGFRSNRFLLMVPGPTPVDPEVLLSMAMPVLSHTSIDFDSIHREALEMLARVFGTSGRIIVVPGSGGLAIELGVRAVAGPGRRVLVLKAGYFGGYLERAARSSGAEVVVSESRTGRGFTAGDLESLMDEHGGFDVVMLQHVETSTSVANPVREIAGVARKAGARVLVDGVASIGGMEMRMDEWGVDVCLTGSQKALSAPPGLGIVALSREVASEIEGRGESIYFDYRSILREMESTLNYHFTPSVNLVYALRESLRRIMSEGLERRYERHRALAEAVRRGLEAVGIELVAEEGFRADTVTAAYLPEGVDWPSLYQEMRKRHVEIAGGLGSLKGKIFRIGHMGEVTANDVIATLAALERSLNTLGYKARPGEAVAAAQEVILAGGY